MCIYYLLHYSYLFSPLCLWHKIKEIYGTFFACNTIHIRTQEFPILPLNSETSDVVLNMGRSIYLSVEKPHPNDMKNAFCRWFAHSSKANAESWVVKSCKSRNSLLWSHIKFRDGHRTLSRVTFTAVHGEPFWIKKVQKYYSQGLSKWQF